MYELLYAKINYYLINKIKYIIVYKKKIFYFLFFNIYFI